MGRGIFIIGDHTREKRRDVDYLFWLDASKGPVPAPGFVSKAPSVTADEQDALEAGTVLEVARLASWEPNDVPDDKAKDYVRSQKAHEQAVLDKKIEADKQGPLNGFEE